MSTKFKLQESTQYMKIIQCEESLHASKILEIFNYEILNSTALFDYDPRTIDSMKRWFEDKRKGLYPTIGAVNDRGDLMGFTSYGSFRAWPAYKYTVEHSIYVSHQFRRQGVGHRLMTEIIAAATNQEYHVMIAGIESNNCSSINLHHKHNFKFCGRIEHAGYKFGKWLDLDLMQLTLNTPLNPIDGVIALV